MANWLKILISITIVVTLSCLVLWQYTGGDYYTKFEVVEEVTQEIDESDPLAAAGFYDDNSTLQTEVRKEFRFGLLPTPSNLLDKHLLSVVGVSGPFWFLSAVGLAFAFWVRRSAN